MTGGLIWLHKRKTYYENKACHLPIIMANPNSTRNKRFNYFVGVDVSKNKLDISVLNESVFLFHSEIANDPTEIFLFIIRLKTLPKFAICKTIFCLEHTGIYGDTLLECLVKIKAHVVVENALLIKNSLGLARAKYDKIDSLRIAQYAFKNKHTLRFWFPKRTVVSELAKLFTLRNRLVSVKVALTVPLKELSVVKTKINDKIDKLCNRSLSAVDIDIQATESAMSQLIDKDERLQRLFEIITSIPGVGPITAIQLLISTNEFKDISDPRKFACYAGVAPFVRESGIFKGKGRVSSIANKKVKAAMHLCAITGIRSNKDLKDYYARKTEVEGKSKMSVINAIRNKMILRIFSCVNQDRVFEVNYIHQACNGTIQIPGQDPPMERVLHA